MAGREGRCRFRHCMDLESLRGHQPFEELIKPKG